MLGSHAAMLVRVAGSYDGRGGRVRLREINIGRLKQTMGHKDPAKQRENARKWNHENKERKRETDRKWYQENKERKRETGRKWYQENKERRRERKRKWNQENKERKREHNRKWRQANLEYAREGRRRSYYKKRGTKPGDIQHKVFEETALHYLCERGFDLVTGTAAGNAECTETGTHRYPDALLWCDGFAIIVEIDENAHRGAAYDCDFRRMAELCGCLSTCIFFIRYKPDAIDSDLQALEEKIHEIQDQENIDWEFLNFNVHYMFYNEKDRARAEARKLAHYAQPHEDEPGISLEMFFQIL
jgi:superfamily II DNA/RNA helicase